MLKRCARCKLEKNTSEFRKDVSKPDGLQYHCKPCRRDSDASNYTARYMDKYKARNKTRAEATRSKLLEYKLAHPCIKCKESDPTCLDFHHVDPTEKDFELGSRLMGNWDRTIAELAKCVVLCANCHRKFHAGRFDLPEQSSTD